MHCSVITLFPDLFQSAFSQSIIARALKQQLFTISYIQLRDFAHDSYGTVDDHPYGGGHGMILRVDVVDAAIQYAKQSHPDTHSTVILLDSTGESYTQKAAKELSQCSHIILLCGHYEGFDERISQLVDRRITIGDYILTGGEIPAMVLIDSIVRLIPGVLRKNIATQDESFSENPNLLEYPQYTRPEIYNGQKVPDILLSGNHKEIEKWRKNEAVKKTAISRPDLLKSMKQ